MGSSIQRDLAHDAAAWTHLSYTRKNKRLRGSGPLDQPRSLPLSRSPERGEVAMLWTIFVILLVLWLLGVVTSYTLGGFIHVLLVIAVIMAVMQLIQGRRAL
jgi:uncharacterized protein DUF5670